MSFLEPFKLVVDIKVVPGIFLQLFDLFEMGFDLEPLLAIVLKQQENKD